MPTINNVPTTQYIGPKIVPHFANPAAWDIDTEYDALSIVTNEGNTYWAKYNVPAGIAISNTEYWYLSAYPDAQIQQYRQEVLEYAGQVEGFEDSLEELETSIENVEEDVEFIEVANKVGTSISPSVLGTNYKYYDGESFQANGTCVYNQILYLGCHNNGDTRTIFTAYDISTNDYRVTSNQKLWTREYSGINIGHANSLAYDSHRNRIMISANPGHGIYTTDANFTTINTDTGLWPFELWAGRLGFDHDTNYGWCIDDANGATKFVRNMYVLAPDATEFEFFCSITMPTTDLQDICVKNNKLILATTKNELSIYQIDIENSTCTLVKSYTIDSTDASNIYQLGELEGCDIDENGYFYTTFTETGVDCVTSIPYEGKYKTAINRSVFQVTNATINNDYRDVFANGVSEFKTIGECGSRNINKIRTITYNGTVSEYGDVRLKDVAVTISSGGSVTFNGIITPIGVVNFIVAGNVTIKGTQLFLVSSAACLLGINFTSNATYSFNQTSSGNWFIRSHNDLGGWVFTNSLPENFTGTIGATNASSTALAEKTIYGFGSTPYTSFG